MDPIEDVQVKLAFLERHVEQLDSVIQQLGDELRRLRIEFGELRDLAVTEKTTLESERPPHY